MLKINGLLNRNGKAPTRVVESLAPGVWVGAYRRLVGPSSEVVDTQFGQEVENVAPQYLMAVWKPMRPGHVTVRRYPTMARLLTSDSEAVLSVMLRHVPVEAQLVIPEMEVDWGLIAQIVMLCDPELRPDQQRLMQAVMAREKVRVIEQIKKRYKPNPQGFRSFADTEPGPGTPAS
jgi:hypothetical protein